jgi:hypothetical protein
MSRMTIERDAVAHGLRLTRRAVLLTSLAASLSGCSLWDNWFGEKKTPLPGKREPIAAGQGALKVDADVPKIVLPPPVRTPPGRRTAATRRTSWAISRWATG